MKGNDKTTATARLAPVGGSLGRSDGFSLLETVVAIAICGIVVAALGSATTSGLQQTRNGDVRAQAVQVLNTIGRRVAGGEAALLPAEGSPITLSGDALADVVDLEDAARGGAYRVEIRRDGEVVAGDSRVARYRLSVCHGDDETGTCVRGTTLGTMGAA